MGSNPTPNPNPSPIPNPNPNPDPNPGLNPNPDQARMLSTYGLERSLYDAFHMNFVTQLQQQHQPAAEALILRHPNPDPNSIPNPIPKPYS